MSPRGLTLVPMAPRPSMPTCRRPRVRGQCRSCRRTASPSRTTRWATPTSRAWPPRCAARRRRRAAPRLRRGTRSCAATSRDVAATRRGPRRVPRTASVPSMHEAKIDDTATGRVPAGDGWFILNVAEIGWQTVPGGGAWCAFEAPSARSERLGIGVHVLQPGETPGFYHEEDQQEGFLVLSGE